MYSDSKFCRGYIRFHIPALFDRELFLLFGIRFRDIVNVQNCDVLQIVEKLIRHMSCQTGLKACVATTDEQDPDAVFRARLN
jgi:hypothetical protein